MLPNSCYQKSISSLTAENVPHDAQIINTVTSCPIMPHHASSCPIMPHHASLYPHHASSCPIMSHHASSCPIMHHHTPSCTIMPHHAPPINSFIICSNGAGIKLQTSLLLPFLICKTELMCLPHQSLSVHESCERSFGSVPE